MKLSLGSEAFGKIENVSRKKLINKRRRKIFAEEKNEIEINIELYF
jgi:hypothetical protein